MLILVVNYKPYFLLSTRSCKVQTLFLRLPTMVKITYKIHRRFLSDCFVRVAGDSLPTTDGITSSGTTCRGDRTATCCNRVRASGPPSPLHYITTVTAASVHLPTTVSCTGIRRRSAARLLPLCPRLTIIRNHYSMIFNPYFFHPCTLSLEPCNIPS